MTGESHVSSIYSGNWVPSPADVAVQMRQMQADLQPRYELLDYIGRGGFATVWRARDVLAQTEVAIKRFERNGPRGGSFYRELSVLFRLHHPHIVQPINLLETPTNVRYLILEYCVGGSLRTQLSRARRQREQPALSWVWDVAQQTAEALQAAHQQGIIHRDVKPENVLFAHPITSRTAPTPVAVKLADFGLARLMQEEHRHASSMRLSGSPAYMAPEQFTGTYLPASDLYALGVILIEILQGRALFEGTAEQLAYHHLRTEPNLAALPTPWPELLGPILTKNVEQRPSLSDWLQQVRARRPQPIAAPIPPQAPQPLPRPPMSHDDHLLDRDMDLLHPALTALAALRRGKCLPLEERVLLDQQPGRGYQAHPAVADLLQWEDTPATPAPVAPSRLAPSQESPSRAEHQGSEHQNLASFFDESPVPVPAEPEPAPDEDGYGSVENILFGMDWR